MATKLRRIEEHRKNFNKELKNIKKNQSELKNTIVEMKKKIHYRESTSVG